LATLIACVCPRTPVTSVQRDASGPSAVGSPQVYLINLSHVSTTGVLGLIALGLCTVIFRAASF